MADRIELTAELRDFLLDLSKMPSEISVGQGTFTPDYPVAAGYKLIPRWDVHFEGLEGYRRDSTEPHITHSPQLGDHRYCGLAMRWSF